MVLEVNRAFLDNKVREYLYKIAGKEYITNTEYIRSWKSELTNKVVHKYRQKTNFYAIEIFGSRIIVEEDSVDGTLVITTNKVDRWVATVPEKVVEESIVITEKAVVDLINSATGKHYKVEKLHPTLYFVAKLPNKARDISWQLVWKTHSEDLSNPDFTVDPFTGEILHTDTHIRVV